MAKFLDLITSFEGEWPHTRVSLRLGLFSIVTPIPRLKNRVGSFKVINRATVALTSSSIFCQFSTNWQFEGINVEKEGAV